MAGNANDFPHGPAFRQTSLPGIYMQFSICFIFSAFVFGFPVHFVD